MTETVSIRIRASTHQHLRKIAAQEGVTIMDVLDEWASATWAILFRAELERAATRLEDPVRRLCKACEAPLGENRPPLTFLCEECMKR